MPHMPSLHTLSAGLVDTMDQHVMLPFRMNGNIGPSLFCMAQLSLFLGADFHIHMFDVVCHQNGVHDTGSHDASVFDLLSSLDSGC